MKCKRCKKILTWDGPAEFAPVDGYCTCVADLELRIKELEATLKTLASQAMYACGYTKKGDWKNERHSL